MRQKPTTDISDRFVAVVVSVPDEHFSDEEDICLAAANFVCGRLETHLIENGHAIPEWIKGGCDEDWGVVFESTLGEQIFGYSICFFPYTADDGESQMMVQYYLRIPFLKRLFAKRNELACNHPLHETMRRFGQTFHSSRMLSQAEFDREY